jgi:NitT/TauT family transport system permease protein
MTRKYVLQRAAVLAAQIAAVVLFLWLWQIASDHKVIDPVSFSKPTAIWHILRQWISSGYLWPNLRSTVMIFVEGYVIGTVAGIVLGVLLGTQRWLRELSEPFLAFFNALPRLVLLPLLIVWFGFGSEPKVVLVVTVILLMVALNVASGIREVRPDLLNQARLMGAGPAELVRDVFLPSVGLWVTSTARVTVGYAFNATIAAEFIGSSKGLGYLIYDAQATYQSSQIYAALAVTVVIAIVLDSLLAVVENRATRWMDTRR